MKRTSKPVLTQNVAKAAANEFLEKHWTPEKQEEYYTKAEGWALEQISKLGKIEL
jgi:hypothetical protein